jgi:hypothetical protein
MKYIVKQKKRQNASRRAINREKRIIALMHEKVVIANFSYNRNLVFMYNKICADEIAFEELDNNSKKEYKLCEKYMMWNDYQSLKLEEQERDRVFTLLNLSSKLEEYPAVKQKYRDLNHECKEFRKELTSTEEKRKMFYTCVGIDNLK